MCWKLNPAETIIAGKKKYNESKNVLELHDDECKELRNSTDEELREKLRESKIIAAGQQFDVDMASRATMYSGVAMVLTVYLSTIKAEFVSIWNNIIYITVVILFGMGIYYSRKNEKLSHLREYHNLRAMCIEQILEEREKGRLSIAQNGGRTYVVTLSENTAP